MTVDALLNLALLSMLALVSGLALMEIRDGRLYRAEFGSFEEYCRDKWGWGRAHAHRLIDAAAVVENVSHGRQIEAPATIDAPPPWGERFGHDVAENR